MLARKSVWQFTIVEVCMLCALTGLVVWKTAPGSRTAAPELSELEARYGPERNSQYGEEWIIRDFFNDRRGGFFVDIGANHYKLLSNTYYLEKILGWSGLAIEPLLDFEADYKLHRPQTRFLPFFVSDVSNEQARMYVLGNNPAVTSVDKAFTERYGRDAQAVSAPTITLDDLFAKEKVSHIDFMSMDIELSEPKALAGLDIDRIRPALICIEVHPEVRQQILDYFARHRYVVVGKYLRADENNLYFTPLP